MAHDDSDDGNEDGESSGNDPVADVSGTMTVTVATKMAMAVDMFNGEHGDGNGRVQWRSGVKIFKGELQWTMDNGDFTWRYEIAVFNLALQWRT